MHVLPEWSDRERRDAALDRLAVAEIASPRRETPTAAELDVLRYLSHGCTVQMAADALGRSYSTAHSQIATAVARLAAKNAAHAVAVALRRGLID